MEFYQTEYNKGREHPEHFERGPNLHALSRKNSKTPLKQTYSKESDFEFVQLGIPKRELPLETPKEDSIMISTVMTTIIENYSTDNLLLQPTALVEPHAPAKIFRQEERQLSSQGKSQTGNSWVLQLLDHLFTWIIPLAEDSKTQTNYLVDDKELWRDWEWVLSKTEEIVQKQNEAETERIKNELQSLKNASTSIKCKARFFAVTKNLFASLSQEQLTELGVDLDSSKKSKMISDVVQQCAQVWLNFIQNHFFLNKTLQQWIDYSSGFLEKPYDKGILGSTKELAFSASHGTRICGLNEKVLAEILWAIWKTLMESLRNSGCELDETASSLLAEEVCKCKENFIYLWVTTVKNSRNGVKKEGVLVQKWKQEEKLEELRISKIMELKGIDAKYVPTRYTNAHCKEKQEMDKIKKFLEQRLSFYVS